MQDLDTATALITGAAKGIGRGIARALADQGVRLALVDLDRSGLDETATELGGRTSVETYELDVRDREAFAEVVDRAESRLGPITVLCNNAGLVFPEDVTTLTYEVWDLALGVNLHGVVNGVQTVLPRMIDRGEPAHIVNTASVAGLGPGGGLLYTTGKYAVVGMSEALRDRLAAAGLPIGVTVLCPGAVATEITATGLEAVSGLRAEESRAARAYADRLTEPAAELLARYGKDPDEVGRMVLDAIRTDRMFVLTDRVVEEKLQERTRRILASMPAAPARDEDSIYQSAAALRERWPGPPRG